MKCGRLRGKYATGGAAAVVAITLAAAPRTAPAQSDPAVIAGQVADGVTGRPVGGAVVTLAAGTPRPAPFGPDPRARRGVVVADALGRFVFRDVAPDSYSLSATRDGYSAGATGRQRPEGPTTVFAVTAGSRITDATVRLWPLASIAGTVRDDRGDPAIGVAVSAIRRDSLGGFTDVTIRNAVSQVTDDRGTYRLSSLRSGSYIVVVRMTTESVREPDGRTPAPDASAVAAAIARSTAAVSWSGAGLLLDGWRVSVGRGMPQPFVGPGATLLVHPSTFHQDARTAADATMVTVESGGDRTGVDFVLPLVAGVRVSGTLRDTDGLAAYHGVRLVPVSANGPTADLPSARGTTDATGGFALFGVTPGQYLLRAFRAAPLLPQGGERAPAPSDPNEPSFFAEMPVTVGSSPVDGLSLTLRRGARLSGRVIVEGAMPSAGAVSRMWIGLRPQTGGAIPGIDVRPDADGRFQTPGHPPGQYHIYTGAMPVVPGGSGHSYSLASVRIAGIDVAGQAITLGADDVADVVITIADTVTRITGDVRGASSPDGVTVVAFPADWREWIRSGLSPRRVAEASVTRAGAYDLRLPLPGQYRVVAVPPDIDPEITPEFAARFASSGVAVTVVAGETKTQSLTVSRPR